MGIDSVSFVTITKDRPGLLAEAAQSIVNQHRKGPTQWVVVNNGGRGCRRVCEEIVRDTDVELTYLEEPSPQIEGRVRNHGLQAAEGNWVGFLDDDDLLMPRHTEMLLSVAEVDTPALVYGGALMAAHADSLDDVLASNPSSAFRFPYVPEMLGIADYLTINAALFSHDLLAEVRLEEASSFSNVFDWDFWIALEHTVTPDGVQYVDEATTVTRRSPGNNMTSLLGPAKRDFKRRIIAGIEQVYAKWPAINQRQREFRELFLQLETRAERLLASNHQMVDFEWLHMLYALYELVADPEISPLEAESKLLANFERLLTSGSGSPGAAALSFTRSLHAHPTQEA